MQSFDFCGFEWTSAIWLTMAKQKCSALSNEPKVCHVSCSHVFVSPQWFWKVNRNRYSFALEITNTTGTSERSECRIMLYKLYMYIDIINTFMYSIHDIHENRPLKTTKKGPTQKCMPFPTARAVHWGQLLRLSDLLPDSLQGGGKSHESTGWWWSGWLETHTQIWRIFGTGCCTWMMLYEVGGCYYRKLVQDRQCISIVYRIGVLCDLICTKRMINCCLFWSKMWIWVILMWVDIFWTTTYLNWLSLFDLVFPTPVVYVQLWSCNECGPRVLEMTCLGKIKWCWVSK